MIYTDGIHIMSDDSLNELHTFAAKVGLKRCWFDNNRRHPHYDIPKKLRHSSIVFQGTKLVSSKYLIKLCERKEIVFGIPSENIQPK